jgi:hypothetical protein
MEGLHVRFVTGTQRQGAQYEAATLHGQESILRQLHEVVGTCGRSHALNAVVPAQRESRTGRLSGRTQRVCGVVATAEPRPDGLAVVR